MSLFLSETSLVPFNTTSTESLRKTAYLFQFVFSVSVTPLNLKIHLLKEDVFMFSSKETMVSIPCLVSTEENSQI